MSFCLPTITFPTLCWSIVPPVAPTPPWPFPNVAISLAGGSQSAGAASGGGEHRGSGGRAVPELPGGLAERAQPHRQDQQVAWHPPLRGST